MGGDDHDELKNLIKVWILAITSLSYCYYISSAIPKGLFRLFSLLPIFYLFILLPLSLFSFHFCGPTSFFLVWLANFKLLLFSFNQGPLSPPQPNLLHFISLACLPIKIKNPSKQSLNIDHQNPLNLNTKIEPNPSHQTTLTRPYPSPDLKSTQDGQTPPTNFSKKVPTPILLSIKILLLALFFRSYTYKEYLHPNVILAIYCCHMYIELEIGLALSATPARAILGYELEPQFNEPYLATSLQDFWGRRWNLMVTGILRPTVYNPTRRFSTLIIGQRLAPLPAVVATFAVSGLMHEAIYYYLTRVRPTWEVTWFFVLHGICTAAEIAAKKTVPDKWRLSPVVSGPLAVVFVAVTGVWLFFPQLVRNGVDEKAIKEYSILVNFVKHQLFSLFSFFNTII